MPWWSWLALPFASITRSTSLLRKEKTFGHLYVRVIEANNLIPYKHAASATVSGDDGGDEINSGGERWGEAAGTPGLFSAFADLFRGAGSGEGGGGDHHRHLLSHPYSNPFVEVSVGQHVISGRCTRVIPRTTEPKFDEAFVFAVQETS